MNQCLFSSDNMSWCTPQPLYESLDREFHFVLDPACTHRSAKCDLHYTISEDGLSQSWNVGGSVFCNPPYGKSIGKWVKKAYEESLLGATIVLLIPARTDTAYFHDFIYGKADIRFLRGRIHFCDEGGIAYPKPAPFPSMIIIYNYNERTNEQ